MLASPLFLPSLLAAKFEAMLGLEDLGLVAVSLVPFHWHGLISHLCMGKGFTGLGGGLCGGWWWNVGIVM